MKSMQKIGRSRGAKSVTPTSRVGPKNVSRQTGVVQAENGESARIRVLDYLGGGKLVVDLKGERVVANTSLFLEKGQELEVVVKNIGDTIVLQLMSDTQQSMSLEAPSAKDAPLDNILHQLMASLDKAEAELPPKSDSTLKQLIQGIRELVKQMPVDIEKGNISQQVQNAISAQGHNYERKLAEALLKGFFPADEITSKLKAKLMQLHAVLSEESQQSGLLESIEKMLGNMEFQQLKSAMQTDRFQHLYMQIPFMMHDQTTTAEVDFFRPRSGDGQDDDNFSIVLSFDLQRLGHMEFTINVMDKHIDCQIKANEYETYALTKQHVEELNGRLSALGYSVGGVHCIIADLESRAAQYQSVMGMDDLDITV